MRKLVLVFLLFVASSAVRAVEVPSEIEFGGMELRLTEEVRRLLKADIELITKSPKGFQIKVDRANLYFPIIERIFVEENLPDDFKFLALQESSLVPDAISSSHAVGYWQFKKESAVEVGLRVDHEVDERMNIIAASRGAARYLKKNNVALNNWIYALLSYNLGLGGVKSKVEEKYIGSRKMTIDKDMHWYVIRFLAHKLAYQDAVGKQYNPALLLVPFEDCKSKSLKDISKETEVEVENLEMYNKWILKNKIPDDKEYYVILPLSPEHKNRLVAQGIITDVPGLIASNETHKTNNKEVSEAGRERPVFRFRRDEKKPQGEYVATGSIEMLTAINGVRAIKAQEGDTPAKLAMQGGIHVNDFLYYNDMKSFETVVPGRIYYLQPKRNRAIVLFHTVEDGESLRDVSQKYGIKIGSIRIKNRMDRDERIVPGRVLWLRSKRPKNVAVEVKKTVPKSEPPIVVPQPKEEIVEIPAPIHQEVQQEVHQEEVIHKPVAPIVKDSFVVSSGFHQVKAGETLYSISRQYSVSLDSIRSWNHIVNNEIKPGMNLIVKQEVRKGKAVENDEIVIEHTVSAGETLYQISKKYGVAVTDIQKWNNKTDNHMAVGEKIIIRKNP